MGNLVFGHRRLLHHYRYSHKKLEASVKDLVMRYCHGPAELLRKSTVIRPAPFILMSYLSSTLVSSTGGSITPPKKHKLQCLLELMMMGVAIIAQLSHNTCEKTASLHMTVDSNCDAPSLRFILPHKLQSASEVSTICHTENHNIQTTDPVITPPFLTNYEIYYHTLTMPRELQVAPGPTAQPQTGSTQLEVGYRRPQDSYDTYALELLASIERQCDPMYQNIKAQRSLALETCHKSLSIPSGLAKSAVYFQSVSTDIRTCSHELLHSDPSSPGQCSDNRGPASCPSLISDSDRELDWSDSASEDGHATCAAKYHRGWFAVVGKFVTAYCLAQGNGRARGSKDHGSSHDQKAGKKSGNTQASQCGPSSRPPRRSRGGKRNCPDGRHNQDPEDGSGADGRKRAKHTPSVSSEEASLLACPFYKFDPLRYSEVNHLEKDYRGCSGAYLTGISRLK